MKIVQALDLLLFMLQKGAEISSLIKSAQAEGRDLTEEEFKSLMAGDDAARATLAEAIERAKAEGR